MHILIDSNILIDYCFRKEYAINFFEEAARERYQIYLLEDVYAETKNLAPNFFLAEKLITRFMDLDLYHRVKSNKKLGKKSEVLTEKCNVLLGHDLDRTDRKLISYYCLYHTELSRVLFP